MCLFSTNSVKSAPVPFTNRQKNLQQRIRIGSSRLRMIDVTIRNIALIMTRRCLCFLAQALLFILLMF
jgi:hypothetical protein